MKKFYYVKSFDTSPQELWNEVKGEHKGLSVKADAIFTKGEDNKYRVICSTDTEDRHLERVYQNFNLKAFKNNPVFLDSHSYDTIENILGRVENIKVKDNKLQGDVVFALDNPKGLLAMNLTEKGFLNAVSIGFIPLAFDEKGDITRAELLELSAVAVPANSEALFDRKSIGETEEAPETPPEAKNDDLSDEKPEVKHYIKPKAKHAYKAVKRLRDEQKELLLKIADCFKLENPQEQKRKIFNAIRENLK